MVHQKTPYGNVGRFFLCLRLWESSAWCRRGREQHVRAVSVPPGSNSPVDCWKVRGSLRGLISQKGDCPYPFGGAHASRKRLHSPRGDRSLKTFHWNVFLTLPLMVHQKQPYTVCRAVFLLQHPGTLRLSRCRRGREQLVPAACSGGHKIERGSLWCLISRKEGLHHPLRGSRMRCANVCVHLA